MEMEYVITREISENKISRLPLTFSALFSLYYFRWLNPLSTDIIGIDIIIEKLVNKVRVCIMEEGINDIKLMTRYESNLQGSCNKALIHYERPALMEICHKE